MAMPACFRPEVKTGRLRSLRTLQACLSVSRWQPGGPGAFVAMLVGCLDPNPPEKFALRRQTVELRFEAQVLVHGPVEIRGGITSRMTGPRAISEAFQDQAIQPFSQERTPRWWGSTSRANRRNKYVICQVRDSQVSSGTATRDKYLLIAEKRYKIALGLAPLQQTLVPVLFKGCGLFARETAPALRQGGGVVRYPSGRHLVQTSEKQTFNAHPRSAT